MKYVQCVCVPNKIIYSAFLELIQFPVLSTYSVVWHQLLIPITRPCWYHEINYIKLKKQPDSASFLPPICFLSLSSLLKQFFLILHSNNWGWYFIYLCTYCFMALLLVKVEVMFLFWYIKLLYFFTTVYIHWLYSCRCLCNLENTLWRKKV